MKTFIFIIKYIQMVGGHNPYDHPPFKIYQPPTCTVLPVVEL